MLPLSPTDRVLVVAALVCFVIATPPLGLRISGVALGLALLTLALLL